MLTLVVGSLSLPMHPMVGSAAHGNQVLMEGGQSLTSGTCQFKGMEDLADGGHGGFESKGWQVADVDACTVAYGQSVVDLSINHRELHSACFHPKKVTDHKKRPVCSDECQYKDLGCYSLDGSAPMLVKADAVSEPFGTVTKAAMQAMMTQDKKHKHHLGDAHPEPAGWPVFAQSIDDEAYAPKPTNGHAERWPIKKLGEQVLESLSDGSSASNDGSPASDEAAKPDTTSSSDATATSSDPSDATAAPSDATAKSDATAQSEAAAHYAAKQAVTMKSIPAKKAVGTCIFRGMEDKEGGGHGGFESANDVSEYTDCSLEYGKRVLDMSSGERTLHSACFKPKKVTDWKKRPACSDECQFKDLGCYKDAGFDKAIKDKADKALFAAQEVRAAQLKDDKIVGKCTFRGMEDKEGGGHGGFESADWEVNNFSDCNLEYGKSVLDMSTGNRKLHSACFKPKKVTDWKKRPACSDECQFKDLGCYKIALPGQAPLMAARTTTLMTDKPKPQETRR
jgi:endogenous inhibitor of DNA gyrase (YacG/DUF329 family)